MSPSPTKRVLWLSILAFSAIDHALAQCSTVLSIYKALGGIPTTTNGCSLPGVVSTSGKVTKINWYMKGLKNSIPISIGNLIYLEELWISRNSISGPIPKEIGKLTKLKILALDNNQLSGPIPIEIGKLTSLTQLWLGYNQLSGSIPTQIQSLKSLIYFYLHNNNFSGTIPIEIGGLTSAIGVGLDHNQLSGSIPKEVGNLLNLSYLCLTNNTLTGVIPAEIGNLINLTSFFADYNKLSGSIPATIGKLTKIRFLGLYYNSLSGSIPTTIGDIPSIEYLYLNNNLLSGSIPKEMGKLVNIKTLILCNNSLSGFIPSELGNIKGSLYLSDNKLTGAPRSLLNSGSLFSVLFPNPMSDIPYDLVATQPSSVLSPTNWTFILDNKPLTKRQQSSSLSTDQLLAMCPLNNVQNADVPAGCVAGIYNKYCLNVSNLGQCQASYDLVVASSIFKPLGVCAAWKSGFRSSTCTSAITSFRVSLDYITLTPTHAQDFVNKIFGSKVYAPCYPTETVKCFW